MFWEYLGAFLSGVGSVIGATYAIKIVVKRCDETCEKRLADFKEGLSRGHEEGNHPDG